CLRRNVKLRVYQCERRSPVYINKRVKENENSWPVKVTVYAHASSWSLALKTRCLGDGNGGGGSGDGAAGEVSALLEACRTELLRDTLGAGRLPQLSAGYAACSTAGADCGYKYPKIFDPIMARWGLFVPATNDA
ncbi:hypothetical protein C0J52_13691, partial [Blattella germanica]